MRSSAPLQRAWVTDDSPLTIQFEDGGNPVAADSKWSTLPALVAGNEVAAYILGGIVIVAEKVIDA